MGKVNLSGNRDNEVLVLTPGGLVPESAVHFIDIDKHVEIDEGTVKEVETLSKKVVRTLGCITDDDQVNNEWGMVAKTITDTPEEHTPFPGPETDRWIVYAGWKNDTGKAINFFSTEWVVPPPPATDNGQLIYLFNGIEAADYKTILQPVLQWGVSPAGGGNFWAIANWFVSTRGSGMALHGPLIKVEPGTPLRGIMKVTGKTNGNYNYHCSFFGFPAADFTMPNIDQLVWACETLECYKLKAFSDYPDTRFTSMDRIDIRLEGGQPANLNWISFNDVTDNGQHCDIISNASPNGRVDLFYTK